MLKLKNAGDTIVEVLISVAVLSLVVGFAYNLAIVSGDNIQSAQQHTEALTLAQNQIEYIREFVQGGNTISTPVECLSDNQGTITETSGPSYCIYSNENACNEYDVNLNALTDKVYQVVVTWPCTASGNANSNNVTLYYEYAPN